MERFCSLDLDLECDGAVTEKGGKFRNTFKMSSKSSEPLSTPMQDNSSAHCHLDATDDNLPDSSNQGRNCGLGGLFKQSPKPAKHLAVPQEKLLVDNELSASKESLSENNNTKEKGGIFSGIFKKSPKLLTKRAHSQENVVADLSVNRDLPESSASLPEPTSKGGVMGKIIWNPFTSASRQEEETVSLTPDSNKRSTSAEKLSKTKQQDNATRPDSEKPSVSTEKESSQKQNFVVGALSKLNPFRYAAKKDTDVAEPLRESVKQPEEVDKKTKMVDNSNLIQQGQMERGTTPEVPPRPTKEELKGTATAKLISREAEDREAKRNMIPGEKDGIMIEDPVLPLKPTEEKDKEEEEEANPTEIKKIKIKKTKKHNPFMPRGIATGKPMQKNADGQPGARGSESAENKDGKMSLFDQLEEFRVDQRENVEDLMEWWNTVEQWDDVVQEDDLTEKEEAKAFALTAEKVQKGIRVFNKLFSERAESLWQHVIDLNGIADGLDRFNKKTKIAQITGGSTSAIGGVTTIAGLALAPVTMGTSLIITAVGLGVATAGGITSAGAGISNQVNNSLDRKKVERIVEDYQSKMADINNCMKFIKQGMENLRRFDLLKMKKHAYNRDFPGLTNLYEDGAMAGKAILINANEIMRVVQIANMAGSTAARAVQIASMATGVLTGLFVGMDIYFVAKDSKELKKGAKSEFATKIREVAQQLHEGLVELNGIRNELQSTETPDKSDSNVNPDFSEKDKKL